MKIFLSVLLLALSAFVVNANAMNLHYSESTMVVAAMVAYGTPITAQKPPGPPADTGRHSDHDADSDTEADSDGGGGGGGGSASPICKSKYCQHRNPIDRKLYNCVCCKSNTTGTITCIECGTVECSGPPVE